MPKKNTLHNESYLNLIPKLTSYGFVAIPLDGKKPILKSWNSLTSTPSKLYIFEKKNIGVLTGSRSGITILDIDKKDNGMETWNRISSVYPPIHTPIVKTQSGGLHIYFRFNKKLHSFSRFTLRGKKIGWDLMNNNRQVVVPNSENEYSWKVSIEDTPIAVMPSWLDEYLTRCKTFE